FPSCGAAAGRNLSQHHPKHEPTMTMLNHFFARLTVPRAVNDTGHDGARHVIPKRKARAAVPFAIRWSALTFAIAFSSVMALAGPTNETPAGLTLQQCLELALQKNPALAVQTAKSAEANSDYRAARAGLLPKLSATGYVNRLEEDRLSPAGGALPGISLFGRESYGGLIARQLLFDGGKTTASRRAAAQGAKLKQMDLDAARDETVYQVSRAFFQAVEARELVPVAEEAPSASSSSKR
ncbi:MAG: TolC family protein, partial [Verrucomicrobiales bacterium]|nr:TolC family protein [Verrucomicrobiales bacterium]